MGKKKKGKGLPAMIFGAALLGSGLTGFGGSIGVMIYQAKQPEYIQTSERLAEINQELSMPIHESDLYLNQDYEEERVRISSLEEESVFLKNHGEKYFSPYRDISLALMVSAFGVIPGLLLMTYGKDKYKLFQRIREEKEKELAKNQ